MSPSLAAMLAAALVAAEPPAPGEEWAAAPPGPLEEALGAIPPELQELQDLALGLLPPPPNTVVRQTRYFGTVTIDHRAHVDRHITCKACHGPKPIRKIVFTPRVAHERCIGCHQAEAKGPTKCQGCHVKSALPPVLVAAAPAVPAAPPKAPEPNPDNVAAALAAFDAPRTGSGGGLFGFGREPFQRWFEVGFVAGEGQGLSVRLASHQDHVVLTQSLERVSSTFDARTLGLFGAGLTRPLRLGVTLHAVALAGFDVVDRPLLALLPAMGVRAGVEWRPRLRFCEQVTASVSAVADLTRRRVSGRDLGGTTIYGTLGTGFSVK